MKRRIGLLLVLVSLATLGVFAPSPASAHEDVCSGQGVATLVDGLGAYQLFPPLTTKFHFELYFGGCVDKGNLVADGYVTGNCGNSYGGGTVFSPIAESGHDFAFTSTGGFIVVTGEITGSGTVTVDVTRSDNSCTNKTARNFLITGSVTKTHEPACSTDTESLTTDCHVIDP